MEISTKMGRESTGIGILETQKTKEVSNTAHRWVQMDNGALQAAKEKTQQSAFMPKVINILLLMQLECQSSVLVFLTNSSTCHLFLSLFEIWVVLQRSTVGLTFMLRLNIRNITKKVLMGLDVWILRTTFIHVIRTQQNTLSNISCDDNVLNNYFHKFMNLLIWFFIS